MISAAFIVHDDLYKSFRIDGHSGYAPAGGDIVCAGVTACTQYALNLLEAFGIPCSLHIDEPLIDCSIGTPNAISDKIIRTLHAELASYESLYPQYVKTEVTS